MSRNKINFDMSTFDFVSEMSEGNPGAINVLMMMITKNPDTAFLDILSLDDMNIRGPQIWVGLKYFCEGDLDKFIECVRNRSKEMVNAINKEMLLDKNYKHIAVTNGASFNRETP